MSVGAYGLGFYKVLSLLIGSGLRGCTGGGGDEGSSPNSITLPGSQTNPKPPPPSLLPKVHRLLYWLHLGLHLERSYQKVPFNLSGMRFGSWWV